MKDFDAETDVLVYTTTLTNHDFLVALLELYFPVPRETAVRIAEEAKRIGKATVATLPKKQAVKAVMDASDASRCLRQAIRFELLA